MGNYPSEEKVINIKIEVCEDKEVKDLKWQLRQNELYEERQKDIIKRLMNENINHEKVNEILRKHLDKLEN